MPRAGRGRRQRCCGRRRVPPRDRDAGRGEAERGRTRGTQRIRREAQGAVQRAVDGDAALTADAFIHLPSLRDRVTDPQKSLLRLTPEMFAMWEQRARAAGFPAHWRLSDEVIEQSRLSLLGDHRSGDDLWIYCYGSLMWDPGFHFTEARLADARGYQRRFALKHELGRGSRKYPGLMLSLERQEGCCRGLAFRIAADVVHAESAILWRRGRLPGCYSPARVPMSAPPGAITPLALVS